MSHIRSINEVGQHAVAMILQPCIFQKLKPQVCVVCVCAFAGRSHTTDEWNRLGEKVVAWPGCCREEKVEHFEHHRNGEEKGNTDIVPVWAELDLKMNGDAPSEILQNIFSLLTCFSDTRKHLAHGHHGCFHTTKQAPTPAKDLPLSFACLENYWSFVERSTEIWSWHHQAWALGKDLLITDLCILVWWVKSCPSMHGARHLFSTSCSGVIYSKILTFS